LARLNLPITGMVRSGSGYRMVGEGGGVFDFSANTVGFKGSLGANPDPAHRLRRRPGEPNPCWPLPGRISSKAA
jgi:hypothetical protein